VKAHRWTAPTPVRTPVPSAAPAEQRQSQRPKQQPAREPTAEEVQAAAEVSSAGLLVSADQNARRKARQPDRDRRAQFRRDKAGAPCGCGSSPGVVCLAHYALTGHRRHIRP
jgi:hypothetical protein